MESMNLLVTLLLIVVPSRFAPVTVERASAGGFTLAHEVPPATAEIGARGLEVLVSRDDGDPIPVGMAIRLLVRQNDRPYRDVWMEPIDAIGNSWTAALPVFPRGSLVRYRFEARLPDGTAIDLPAHDAPEPAFRYVVVGPAPARVTLLRDGALWLSLLFAFIAVLFGMSALRRRSGRAQFDWAVVAGALATLTLFVGSICLSWVHSFYTTGAMWATLDGGRNHLPYPSLAITAYWALVMVGMRGRLVHGSPASERAMGWGALALGAGAFGILIYLATGPASP